MRINSIRLNNFRGYRGENELDFSFREGRNITIMAGKNGFGKTTFLTSLIWAFYGRLMGQVEDKYKKEIRSAGGYDNFLLKLVNKHEKWQFDEGHLPEVFLEVEVELEDLLIPSIPCRKVKIKRSYSLNSKEENLSILIDGDENELTKEVGFEVFINDFILPREIAKFFFFDAEKIVSLAEAKTKAELRALSKAYSEVLGIKKYEELKNNLEALLTKLRRSGVTNTEKSKLDELINIERDFEKQLQHYHDKQRDLINQMTLLKANSDSLQEKLIREGNGISLEELKDLKRDQEDLKQKSTKNKEKIRKLLELAPFVIAGKSLVKFNEQLENELYAYQDAGQIKNIENELEAFSIDFFERIKSLNLSEDVNNTITSVLADTLGRRRKKKATISDGVILLDFPEELSRGFAAIFSNIKTSFVHQLNMITQEEKNAKILLSQTTLKIKQAEARKDNPLAKQFRKEKSDTDKQIAQLEEQKNFVIQEIAGLNIKLGTHRKVLSEYEKKFRLVETDKKKYLVTEQLLEKINDVIEKIKQEKKYSLQKSIKLNLKKLMHKKNFVHDVIVKISEDVMDIDLTDERGFIIDKEGMSKGEQQLYATALLKALVEQSGINFPVFIDSPLQKFDDVHSINIIKEFYPAVSEQVVLFPLLEKELSKEEFEHLKPFISQSFLIRNNGQGSNIQACTTENLFSEFKNQNYVLTH